MPPKGCRKCKRLVDYRRLYQKQQAEWFNGAVPPWGPQNAPLLIIGLAPGLKGAHRTGRVFTGDSAGGFLFDALIDHDFVEGTYDSSGNDNLKALSVCITNAVACVPPQNKPTPEEIRTCQPFLLKQIKSMPNLKAILCLGTLAHQAFLTSIGLKKSSLPFRHGIKHRLDDLKENGYSPVLNDKYSNITLFNSYHCSRYNTQTGRLTKKMFYEVLRDVKSTIDATSKQA